MRFKYSTTSANQNEFDSLPRIPIVLHRGDPSIAAIGLVDSGATVNVLPYQLGLELALSGTIAELLFNYLVILAINQPCPYLQLLKLETLPQLN